MNLVFDNVLLLGFLTTVVALIGVWLKKRTSLHLVKRHDSAQLVEFLSNRKLSEMNQEQKLVTEVLLGNMFKKPVSYEEASALINTQSPLAAIEAFARYKRHLNVSEGKVEYKGEPFKYIKFRNINIPLPLLAAKGIFFYFITFIISIGCIHYAEMFYRNDRILLLGIEMSLKIGDIILLGLFGLAMFLMSLFILFDSLSCPNIGIMKKKFGDKFRSE